MSIWSIPKFCQRLMRRFASADQGNIAVIFAITLVPVIGFIGAAIDYSRANAARSAMQVAMDSAALMVSKDVASGAITSAQVASKAQAYFNALYTNTNAGAVTITATYTNSTTAGSTIQLSGSSSVPTQFMKTVGFSQLGIGTSSTTSWGTTKMRVAMALDNTGSMNDSGKIAALKTAAKNLVDQLSALATNTGDVYISVVPFAKDVNIGSSNYAQNWIDWTDWEAEAPDLVGTANKPSNWAGIGPGSACPWTMRNNGFTCLAGPASTTVVTTIPSTGTYAGYICPGPDPSSGYGYAYHYLINGCYTSTASSSTTTVSTGSYATCTGYVTCTCTGSGSGRACKATTYTHTWTPNNHNTWSGCLADRTQSYDTQNTAPNTLTTATLFPAEQYYENFESYCTSSNSPLLQPVTPLSYNWTTIKSNIDAMQPTGGTNQPIGLAQAWQTLAQTAPYNAPAEASNYTYAKSIILLSDGLNTENRWPAYGNGSSQTGTMIDNRQKILCDNIKAAGITIYTVQVNTGGDPTSTVLQYCASGSSNFYLVTSASQTAAVFSSIGNSLTQLRVSK